MRNREDWLVEQLNNDSLSLVLRQKYEAELDRLADRYEAAELSRKNAEAKERARRAEIRAKIEAKDEDFIWTMGTEEFGHDYEVVIEGSSHVVYSKVARDDQDHRHVCDTAEAANRKLRTLLYYRLYDKYVRTGEFDCIAESVA